jgi:hypothetical protein
LDSPKKLLGFGKLALGSPVFGPSESVGSPNFKSPRRVRIPIRDSAAVDYLT